MDEVKKQCKWMHQFPIALFKIFSCVLFLVFIEFITLLLLFYVLVF